jgi:hypothetical protein
LAIDLHTTPKIYSNEAGVDGYTKKYYTEINIRKIWRIHSRENGAWFVFEKFDAAT